MIMEIEPKNYGKIVIRYIGTLVPDYESEKYLDFMGDGLRAKDYFPLHWHVNNSETKHDIWVAMKEDNPDRYEWFLVDESVVEEWINRVREYNFLIHEEIECNVGMDRRIYELNAYIS